MRFQKQIVSGVLALSLGMATAQAASFTIPAGATLAVRVNETLDSKISRTGQTFRASVDAPVMLDGQIVVPKGAEAIGRITQVEAPGRFKGRSYIAVELTALNFDGKSVTIRTSSHQEGGAPRTKQTAILIGGGAALGTVLGAIGGSPWLGLRAGAAAGTITNTVRGPGKVRIPAETLLQFTLQSPMPVDNEM